MPEEINKQNIIIVDGMKFYQNSTKLEKDYFTKEIIIREKSFSMVKAFTLHPIDGLTHVDEFVWTKNPHMMNEENTFILRSAHGKHTVVKDYIMHGSGKLYPSIVEEDANYIFYDEWANKRQNNKDKFRPFDNLVRAYKDLDSPAIPDEDKKQILERDIKFGVRTITNKIFEGLDYTYGIELETSSGRVSEKEAEGLNLKCEFDGSLRETPDQKKEDVLGGEYITGVLIGDSGMKQLNDICTILSKKCTISNKCGVHVHIGNLIFTKENIVYMYILGRILEDEIFSIMPKSRRGNSYCRKLKNLGLQSKGLNKTIPLAYDIQIDEYYNLIFKEVSGGRLPDKKTNKLTNHPAGSKCGYNKEAQRYCWLNFVSAMFNTKGSTKAYTLEFRIHYATLNYIKVKHWLKICVAFVNFAENHKASIKRGYWIDKYGDKYPISLTTIVKASYPRSSRLIEEYIEERKARFLMDNGEIEAIEYSKDKEGVTSLNILECVL